jgi:hypothetical protein
VRRILSSWLLACRVVDDHGYKRTVALTTARKQLC